MIEVNAISLRERFHAIAIQIEDQRAALGFGGGEEVANLVNDQIGKGDSMNIVDVMRWPKITLILSAIIEVGDCVPIVVNEQPEAGGSECSTYPRIDLRHRQSKTK